MGYKILSKTLENEIIWIRRQSRDKLNQKEAKSGRGNNPNENNCARAFKWAIKIFKLKFKHHDTG